MQRRRHDGILYSPKVVQLTADVSQEMYVTQSQCMNVQAVHKVARLILACDTGAQPRTYEGRKENLSESIIVTLP